MIRDLLDASPAAAYRPDVCIVGAGAAGIVLAVELAQKGKRVVLLEAGGATYEERSQDPIHGSIGGLPHRGLHEGRFRVQGGTTTRWGGQILELDELDFQERSWVAQSGWPITKRTLAPYYRRAKVLEGVDGASNDDEEVWRLLGEPQPRFADFHAYLSRWCPQPNFARLHRKVLENHPSIEVWLHANAFAIELTDDAATSVQVKTQSGRQVTFQAEEFIFCLGAIESSRFFLQPRESGLPWNNSGLLGQHFQDHIDCNLAKLLPHSRIEIDRIFDSIFLHGFKYQPKLKLTRQFQEKHQTLNAAITLAYQGESDQAMTELRTTAKELLRGRVKHLTHRVLRNALANFPELARQTLRYTVEHRGYQPVSSGISIRAHCEQEPSSKSTVTLSTERDSVGLFRTHLSWVISPLELHTLSRVLQCTTASFSKIGKILPSAKGSDPAALRALCEDSFHHMGGMRMSHTVSAGVVDTDLRLHGTKNVYVCSGAVFPTSGFSNPTHTLLALALRLADHLCNLSFRQASCSVGESSASSSHSYSFRASSNTDPELKPSGWLSRNRTSTSEERTNNSPEDLRVAKG